MGGPQALSWDSLQRLLVRMQRHHETGTNQFGSFAGSLYGRMLVVTKASYREQLVVVDRGGFLPL